MISQHTLAQRRGLVVAGLYGLMSTTAIVGALIGHGIHRAIRKHRKERT